MIRPTAGSAHNRARSAARTRAARRITRQSSAGSARRASTRSHVSASVPSSPSSSRRARFGSARPASGPNVVPSTRHIERRNTSSRMPSDARSSARSSSRNSSSRRTSFAGQRGRVEPQPLHREHERLEVRPVEDQRRQLAVAQAQRAQRGGALGDQRVELGIVVVQVEPRSRRTSEATRKSNNLRQRARPIALPDSPTCVMKPLCQRAARRASPRIVPGSRAGTCFSCCSRTMSPKRFCAAASPAVAATPSGDQLAERIAAAACSQSAYTRYACGSSVSRSWRSWRSGWLASGRAPPAGGGGRK